jgi:DNA invertase Pin-like site-specific DNA recombinase
LTAFAARAGYDVTGVFTETASGTATVRAARNQVMALAQARKVDVILVTELSRWGRSTQDLLDVLGKLAAWKVSVVAMSGMTFELETPHGRMMATLLAGIAQFERDLISERVKSGLAAARARGDARVVLDVASDAAGFYARAGFVDDGEASEAEGLRHQAMVLLDGWGGGVSGLERIDGKVSQDNETTHRGWVH